jgi:hypothetical protein
MKMTWIFLLIGIVVGTGSHMAYEYFQPPKTQIINQYTTQTVDNKNTSIQTSQQDQITAVISMDKSFTNVNINFNGRTNILITKSSKTNITHKTNK